jgi:hypothetical protein
MTGHGRLNAGEEQKRSATDNVPTEISLSAPKAALKALFFRMDMTLRDVFSAKSISMYRCSLAACWPFYLPPKTTDPSILVSHILL